MEKMKKRRETEEFIMSPTVDICFKELMQNPKVRKGMVAAILGKDPDEIESTVLMPTILQQEYADDKLGILDARVKLVDGEQIDVEMQNAFFAFWPNRVLFYLGKMYTSQLKEGEGYENLKQCVHVSILNFIHFPDDNICFRAISFCEEGTGKIYTDKMKIYVLELPKLPPEQKNEKDIIRWMRFLRAKSRKEFEKMAERDEYIQEAYEALKRMSADEKKRLEYEAREKALRDYNTQMYSAEKRGIEAGMKIGEKRMLEQAKRTVQVLKEMGMPMEQIVQAVGREENEVKSWLEEK
ncbi:Rpn family recombination-promoting nuclease/putative transposase [Ruminococcus sp. AF14-10]|nr:Rpn family recombination-promoting nuclease/putative transposase [Ruminococcus sp. AF14-10]